MAPTPLRHIDPDETDPEIVLIVRSCVLAPAVARAFVRSGVALLGWTASSDSEAVEVSLRRHGRLVRVGVTDDDPIVPEMAPLDPTAVGGFGLRLIDLLSDEWGIEVVKGDGKCVWFEIALPIATPAIP